MSADFFSDVKVLPATSAVRWAKSFKAAEVLSDIIGPDEETLHSFDAGEPNLAAIAKTYAGKRAPPELGPTYVEMTDGWEAYMEEECPSAMHMSSNYATLVAIDRAVAIPHGVTLLGGHAVRRVDNAELAAFAREWRGLMLRTGGAKGMAASCADWIDRGMVDLDELAAFIHQIGTLAQTAIATGADLLLVGYPVP